MAEFTPITSQEELDSKLAERLKRAETKYQEQYAGQIKAQEKQIAELTRTIEESAKQAKAKDEELAGLKQAVKVHETRSVKTRIAYEEGIPYELASRLSGETEDEIRADAQAMKPYLSAPARVGDPLASSEPAKNQSKAQSGNEALRELARSLGK